VKMRQGDQLFGRGVAFEKTCLSLCRCLGARTVLSAQPTERMGIGGQTMWRLGSDDHDDQVSSFEFLSAGSVFAKVDPVSLSQSEVAP